MIPIRNISCYVKLRLYIEISYHTLLPCIFMYNEVSTHIPIYLMPSGALNLIQSTLIPVEMALFLCHL